MKKIEVIPYLSFSGNCEEAIRAYLAAFDGEVLCLSRWSEGSEDSAEGISEKVGKVMHAEFTLGRTRMSAGDSFDTGAVNTGIKLMVHMDAEEEALRAISLLAADGGAVLAPLQPHPAPDDGGCGSITRDRFGYTWIITCPNPAKQQF